MLDWNELTLIWIGGTVAFFGFMAAGIPQSFVRIPADMKSQNVMRLGCGWSALANGIFHSGLCLWTLRMGEQLEYPGGSEFKDLSFFAGPFSDPGLQIKNLLAIPIAVIWLIWGYWINKMATTESKWRRYLFPIIFLALGWLNPDVYPSFFRTDQYLWPSAYTFFWVGIFWSETMSALFGAGCIALTFFKKEKYNSPKKE